MARRTYQIGFTLSSILAAGCFVLLAVLYFTSFRDPRWRVVDLNSCQAAESEIYNVREVPVISNVLLGGPRRLRFEFSPAIHTSKWSTVSESDGKPIHEGPEPEIPFSDEPFTETYRLEPEGVSLIREIRLTISYFPKEGYEKADLSWPDNYYCSYSSVPFAHENRYSVDDWAGLSGDDPDLLEARGIIGGRVDLRGSAIERSREVFCFVMENLAGAGGIPSNELLNASPLETYRQMTEGGAKGFCENQALVYYLFANAAGVRTRLVDIAGKFGPLKLTGHYFCETWMDEEGQWCFVDPQSGIASIRDASGQLLNTLELKRHCDLGTLDGCTVSRYDRESSELAEIEGGRLGDAFADYFRGEIVMAYKFGYPRTRSFSRIHSFLFRPTLLYAPFRLPQYHLIKQFLLAAFAVACLLSLILGVTGLMIRKRQTW